MPVLCWASGSGCMAKLLKILCRLSPCPDPFLRQRPRVPAGVPPADRYQAPLTVQRTFPPSADLPRRLSSWKRLFRSPKPGEDVLPERRRRRASPLDRPLASESRRFREVDGASCRSAANDDPAAAGGGGLAWDRKRRPSRCNFLGRDTDRLFVIRRRRRDRRSRTTAPYVTVARPARSPSRRPSRRPFRPAVTPRSDAPRSAARRG